MEKKIEKLQRNDKHSEKIVKLEAKLENIENSQKTKYLAFETKINTLENKIKTILGAIKGKDIQISALETNRKEMEKTVDNFSD